MKIAFRGFVLCISCMISSCAYDNAEDLYGKKECLPGDPGTSFSLSIAPIIDSNCAISRCHVNGQQQPAFLTYEQISFFAGKIKSRTSNGTMPPPESGNRIEQLEIDKIACWVDDGAPDN